MRRKALIGLALLIPIAGALAWWATHRAQEGEVPVELTYTFGTSNSTRPVETVLHEYIPCYQSDPSCRRFTVTGRSLTFSFPENYYRIRANRSGGPQALIGLYVDRDRLTPLAPVLQAHDNALIYNRDEAPRLRKMLRNNLSLRLETNLVSGAGARRRAEIIRDRLARDEAAPAGSTCGITFSYTRGNQGIPLVPVDDPTALRADIRGFVETLSEQDGAMGARCSSLSPICVIEFEYRRFSGSYNIPKDKICEWPHRTERVIRFLDNHLISSRDMDELEVEILEYFAPVRSGYR